MITVVTVLCQLLISCMLAFVITQFRFKMSNSIISFQVPIKDSIPMVAMAGFVRGSTILVKTCSPLHPSILPASRYACFCDYPVPLQDVQ